MQSTNTLFNLEVIIAAFKATLYRSEKTNALSKEASRIYAASNLQIHLILQQHQYLLLHALSHGNTNRKPFIFQKNTTIVYK